MLRTLSLLLALAVSLPAQIVWENIGAGSQFSGATILWDAANQRFLVVDESPPRIKEWTGTGWQTIATAPSFISFSGCRTCYDAGRQRVVLVGVRSSVQTGVLIAEWDGANWFLNQPINFTPSSSWSGAVIYDPVRQEVVILDVLTRTWDGATLTNYGPSPPYGGLVFNPMSGMPLSPGVPPAQLDATYSWVPMPPTVQGVALGLHFYDPVTNTIQAGETQGWGYDPEYWDGTQWHRVRIGTVSSGYLSMLTVALDPQTNEIWGVCRNGTFRAVRGPRSSVTTFGPGCPGALGMPTVVPSTSGSWNPWPTVGVTTQYQIQGVLPRPYGFAYMVVGFDNASWGGTPLPFDMTALGMPGCWLNQSADYFAQTYFVNIPIPASVGMIGLNYYVQGMGLELFGHNGPGVCMSRSIACTVGVHY